LTHQGTFLLPEGWFTDGHKSGTYVWTPTPAAADVVVVVEQLGQARQKRPESMHLVVVPRVMTGRWRRHMTRGSGFYFKVDWPEVWPLKGHFEPLLIFVCLPYRSCSPRLQERQALLKEFRRDLLGEGVSKYLRAVDSIFCANSLSRRGRFAPCKGAWCGPCYQPLGERIFPVKVLLDDDGEELVDPSESS
jgi:hypothetical protein